MRVICPKCKEKDTTVSAELKAQIIEEMSRQGNLAGLRESDIRFYRGKSCENCNSTGFKGRTAIYEILVVNKAIKELMLEKVSSDRIREEAVKQGMKTLRLSGWEKVIGGITTLDEVMRVTQVEE